MRPFAFRVLAAGVTSLLASACIFGGNGKDGTPSGGGTDAGEPTQGEGGGGGSSTDSGGSGGGDTDAGGGMKDAGPPVCPLPVALTNIPPWNPSVQKVGACTSTDLGILSSYLTEPMASSWASASSMVSSSCQKCVFSNAGDANWGVIVWTPTEAAGLGFINVGGCYQALAAGSNPNACGAAAQQANACEDMACPANCANQSACKSSVQTSACGSSISSAQSACGTNYSNFAASCSEAMPYGLVNIVCGSGSAG